MKKLASLLFCAWITSLASFAQNLTFTIDSASASGGTIMETLVLGTDTYVLSAIHGSGTDAQLFNNGGGDLMFYWGGFATGTQYWTLSLTRNGSPVNFTLKGLDYASFGADSDFNLKNNSNAVITSSTTIAMSSSGAFPITNTANATDISAFIIESTTNYGTSMTDFHNIDVTVVCNIDTSVAVNGTTLTANAAGAAYQWINCNGAPVTGATTQSFSPAMNGNYAVVIYKNGCSDTSACYPVVIMGLREKAGPARPRVYPNPTGGALSIDLGRQYTDVLIKVHNVIGELIYEKSYGTLERTDVEIEGAEGLYFISMYDGKGSIGKIKVVKLHTVNR